MKTSATTRLSVVILIAIAASISLVESKTEINCTSENSSGNEQRSITCSLTDGQKITEYQGEWTWFKTKSAADITLEKVTEATAYIKLNSTTAGSSTISFNRSNNTTGVSFMSMFTFSVNKTNLNSSMIQVTQIGIERYPKEKDFKLSEGSQLVLNCSVKLNLPNSSNIFYWRWTVGENNSIELAETDGLKTEFFQTAEYVNTSLTISSVNSSHQGVYMCHFVSKNVVIAQNYQRFHITLRIKITNSTMFWA